MDRSVAEELGAFLRSMLGGTPPVPITFWDGSQVGPPGATSLHVRSPLALRRLIFSPGELGLSRAFVMGELDVRGSIFEALALRDAMAGAREHHDLSLGLAERLGLVRAAARLGILGLPPAPPRTEARLRGLRHTRRRDAEAISHHYDVGNDFYSIVLGPSMTYSCAYFEDDRATLEAAQSRKHEHVARKLGLEPGMRLLDVGCGWGGMVLHAATHHGVKAVGITISREQADLAAKRVSEAGLADRVEIRLQDYRDVDDGPYDAISSIGMFEHVGAAMLARYMKDLYGLLREGGRLLNHAISRPSGRSAFGRKSFIARYVFPDGELQEVGSVVSAMQSVGYEVRDVESLREHYALTLRQWVSNLESGWDRAVQLVGAERARIWRLYMAGSALAFEAGRINVHQVLGVKPDAAGVSGMPLTRATFA